MPYPLKRLWEIIVLNYWKWVLKEDKNKNWLYQVYWANGVMYNSDKFLFEWESIIIWRKWSAWALTRVSWKFWASDVTYFVTTSWKADLDYIFNALVFLNLPSLAQWVKPWINRNHVYDQKIPLPPLPTQKAIVQKLDSAFEKIDASIDLAEKSLKEIEEMEKSVLEQVFSSFQWIWVKERLSDYVKFIWWSQPPKSTFIYEKKDGYVRLIQIRDYKTDKFLVYVDEKSTKKFCGKCDIMVWRYWPPIFQILRWIEWAYNVALMKSVFDDNEIFSDYLYWFLQNPIIQNYIISKSQRAAWQSWVNKTILDEYHTYFPPLEKQKEIVEYLDRVFEKNKELRELYKEKIDGLKEMKQSLLKEAFEGRLVKD